MQTYMEELFRITTFIIDSECLLCANITYNKFGKLILIRAS